MRTFIFCLALAVAVSGLAVDSTHAASKNENRAQQIAGDLKKSGQLKDYRVGVKYEDGVAWLTGTVTNRRQRQIAEEVARRSPGVTHVVNNLEVENFGYQFESAEYGMREREVASPRRASFAQRPMAPPRRPAMAPRQRRPAAPRNNMPVPYAGAGRQNVRPAGYSRQAQFCPDGNCRTGQGGAMQGRSMQGGGMQGGMRPSPMGGGAPPAVGQAASYDNPQMPGYAWPSYAASSNYAALTYPKQYSPSAWPYIGPFYPYPQVPLGWRKVTLEWDDGWWFLDFKDK